MNAAYLSTVTDPIWNKWFQGPLHKICAVCFKNILFHNILFLNRNLQAHIICCNVTHCELADLLFSNSQCKVVKLTRLHLMRTAHRIHDILLITTVTITNMQIWPPIVRYRFVADVSCIPCSNRIGNHDIHHICLSWIQDSSLWENDWSNVMWKQLWCPSG